MGGCCLVALGFQLGMVARAQWMDDGHGCTLGGMYLMPQNCAFANG